MNYGHALWDDLYSIYTSIVKIDNENARFNLVFDKKYRSTHYLNDIIHVLEKFSKGKNIYLDNLDKEKYILFKKLIVGSSHQCQRCVTLDYSLKYSRKYNITKLIRNRMYDVFSIKPDFSYPIYGIIVNNKRYSMKEKEMLHRVIAYYKLNKFIRLQYIDYKNYSTFENQLKLLSKTHIYISGPGTGLLNFPFMSDPGVVIHLGHIHFGCPQYLEQYILEGSPHIKAIYYSPQLRMKEMNYSYALELINSARRFIEKNNDIYVNKDDNLNEIGKLYVKICKEHKTLCENLIKEYDWGYGKCRGIWAENVVFFPSLYRKIPQLNDVVKLYNNSNNLGCEVGVNYSKQSQWC